MPLEFDPRYIIGETTPGLYAQKIYLWPRRWWEPGKPGYLDFITLAEAQAWVWANRKKHPQAKIFRQAKVRLNEWTEHYGLTAPVEQPLIGGTDAPVR